MAHFEDLSEYVYLESSARPGTLNVGWLGAGHDVRSAMPSDELLGVLWEYCKVSIAQTRGVHTCELCSDEAYHGTRNGEYLLLGTSEIRVFGDGPTIYAAPTLIYHYVAAHHYDPPAAFWDALRRDGAPGPAYFERLAGVGLEWSKTKNTRSECRKPFAPR